MTGWLLDKSAAARSNDPVVSAQLAEIARQLQVCPVRELEQLYSARSGSEYGLLQQRLHVDFRYVLPPQNIFDRAIQLQRDLAHHHGLWHRIPISNLLIAETALYHELGIVHVDADYERIAEVRPLVVRRLG